ncbi:hypothetical protein BaRGS_00019345 [Batillaria attramentaria]|uniref:Uncharacterized protein n=1 Tax=Batillaria attramentaria TaxID=370345 RepID=A0ABD0KQ51_9CAEN
MRELKASRHLALDRLQSSSLSLRLSERIQHLKMLIVSGVEEWHGKCSTIINAGSLLHVLFAEVCRSDPVHPACRRHGW